MFGKKKFTQNKYDYISTQLWEKYKPGHKPCDKVYNVVNS